MTRGQAEGDAARLFKSRVLRGGSWNNNRENARCTNRNRNNTDNSNDNIGFRCVSHDSCRVYRWNRFSAKNYRQCHGSCSGRPPAAQTRAEDAGLGAPKLDKETARPVPGRCLRCLRKAPGEYTMALPPVVAGVAVPLRPYSDARGRAAFFITEEGMMRRTALLFTLACIVLLLSTATAQAQTPVPPPTPALTPTHSTTASPIPTLTSTPTFTPTSTPTLTYTPTLTPTPTPEALELPGAPGEWWKLSTQLFSRYGPWACLGLVALLIPLYVLWKIGEEVAGEEAKGIAARLRKGCRMAWCRLTRRLTREEEAIIKEVRSACQRLELKGFVKEHLIIVSLESVYVPLTTQGTRGIAGRGIVEGMPLLKATEESGAVPLTDLITQHPQLVLVGEAGSGKTTFLKYIALSAANACAKRRSDKGSWLNDKPPLPVYLPLHGFGLYLSDQGKANRESPSPDLLRDYIIHHLRHLELPEGWIADRLRAGNVLILLDGLDEVARFEDRRFIADLVTQFAGFCDKCQVVVTSRPQGYEGAAQLGGDFERRDINPLAWPEDIRTFLYRWNEAINRRAAGGTLSVQGRQQAHENADSLMARLENAPNVRELANNPLLLTVMAIVHFNVGTLPERRADLYNAATELLLGWDKRMGRELQAPPPWLDDLTAAQRRLPLEELAFDFQENRVIEQPRAQVLPIVAGNFLAGSSPDAQEAALTRADEYLKWVTDRTYVLQNIGGVIRFYRKPFQEYLAARRLARKPDLQGRVRQILAEDWRDRWWDETLLLTVGQLITDDPQKANDLLTSVRELADSPEAPYYTATFIARALADVPEGLLGSVWQVKEHAVDHLAEALTAVEPAFSPKARLEASLALGKLGDPRPGTGIVTRAAGQPPVPDILWVQVPDGPFLMGSTDDEIERWKTWIVQKVEEGTYGAEEFSKEQVLEILLAWLEGERGQHQLETPAFLISRYAVTNAHYGCFVESGGYDDPAWWGGEESLGWAWRKGEPRWEWQRTDRPDYWHDPRFGGHNQPVVGVTWYEAMAFCQWLTSQLREADHPLQIWNSGRVDTYELGFETFAVRLPTEAEWEKAARGTDGRTWPWGNDWDETRSNTGETGLGQTSPVGILPAGDSVHGLADAVGNVWEWTSSLWGPDWQRPAFGYPYRADDGREETSPGDDISRVLRGGSWDSHREYARCPHRLRGPTDFSDVYIGFRCVSPVGSDF